MGRDGIPALADPLERPERMGLELRQDIVLHGSWSGEEPKTGAAEGLEQGAVTKFPNNFGPYVVSFEPGVDGASQRIGSRREQQGGTVKMSRKFLSVSVMQVDAPEKGDTHITQQVGLQLQIGPLRCRTVCDDEIKAVERQFPEQVFELALHAVQAELERRLQQASKKTKRD